MPNIKIATDSQKISERTNLEEGILFSQVEKIFNFTSVQKNVKKYIDVTKNTIYT